MFSNCILNPMSVERILTSIPDYSETTDLHLLSLGIKKESEAVVNDITGSQLNLTNDGIGATLTFKGWTININVNSL